MAIKSGNIIFTIIAHFLNNFIIISFEYFNIFLNLFSPIIIACGLILFAVFIFIILICKSKGSNNFTDNVVAKNYILGAGVGLAVCILLLVGATFG